MSGRPALLVAGWTAANLVLAAILAGFGDIALAVVLYFVSAVPAFGYAIAVWRIRGANDEAVHRFRLGAGSDWIPVIAFGLTLVGAGVIFGAALLAVGAVITVLALLLFVRASGRAR
jgi:hypothetical protein